MTKERKETSSDHWSDALLQMHGISQEAVLGENGLIAQVKKASRGEGIVFEALELSENSRSVKR